jgi:gamma-glutamyltranspeptidase/glutathione hydrolase/leukotriene-C4 hydrolase
MFLEDKKTLSNYFLFRDVMLMGGNAIDSSIATMYCNTVVNSQSMGVGGGFIMTIYMANGTKLALIARETAPAAASKDMYHGNANLTHYGKSLRHWILER